MEALTYDEMRPGCYERDARIKDFELNWVDGSLPFPTFPRFCGQTFYEADDKELGLACVKAYNDWMVEEWCGAVRRLQHPAVPHAALGRRARGRKRSSATRSAACRAFCFSELPHHLKLPTIHSGEWDPVFQVCNDTGVTLCMHIGSSSTNPTASPDVPGGVGGTLAFNNSMASLADWLFSGKLIQFPKLKLAYSEGQIGWIPYVSSGPISQKLRDGSGKLMRRSNDDVIVSDGPYAEGKEVIAGLFCTGSAVVQRSRRNREGLPASGLRDD